MTPEQKAKADEFIDNLYLDTTSATCNPYEDTIIRAITRFIVSICTAWWSATELLEYMKTRAELKDLEKRYGGGN